MVTDLKESTIHAFLTFPLWQTITLAHEEAVASGSHNTQPGHLLRVLIPDPDGIAVRIIKDLGALPPDAET